MAPTTFTNNYQIKLIGDGLEAGTWGLSTNENLKRIEQALGSAVSIDPLTPPEGSTQATADGVTAMTWITSDTADADQDGGQGRAAFVEFKNTGSLSGDITVEIRGSISSEEPNRVYFVHNNLTDAKSLILNANDSGAAGDLTIANGAFAAVLVYADATSGGLTSNSVVNLLSNLQVDGLLFQAAADITIPDATESALQITDGTEVWVDIDTRTGAEVISLKTPTVVTGEGDAASSVKSNGAYDLALSTGGTGSVVTVGDGTNGAITLSPAGTGRVVVGSGSASGKITSNGTEDLVLDTNGGSASGSITIVDAANGNISVATNGSGDINLTPATGKVVVGSGSAAGTITTNSTQDLVLDTNDGTASGSITIEDAVNGAITLLTNGDGDIKLTTGSTTGGVLLRDDGYLNFDTTTGTSGYGVRDNSGVVEIKNSGGSWGSPYSAGNTDGDGTFFESAEFTVGTSDDGTESHTFGTVPRIVMGVLRCLAGGSSGGYAEDDEISSGWAGVPNGDRGIVFGANSSEVFYGVGSSTWFLIPKVGGGHIAADTADWALVIRAWK